MTSQIMSKHSVQLLELKKQLLKITSDKFHALRESSPHSGEIKYGMISMVISLLSKIADERKAEESKFDVHNPTAKTGGNSTNVHIALFNTNSVSTGQTLINSSVTVPLQDQVGFCLW